ncbi:MAG: Bug family tripartite tricarboxylate transporter substrate binding protein [Xanthobacteraceae bacterium]
MKRRELLGLGAGAIAAGVAGKGAWAQQYPSQDLHFICGFPAGSGADTIVRFYSEKLKAITGKTIIVENRPGAGANIAIEYVGKAKPDGYTILVHGGSGLAANMHLYKKPPVPSVNAFQVFSTINKQAFMMVVDVNKPWKSVAEVTAAMKEKGDKATYATSAPPSIVMGAIYKDQAGLKAVDVNYRTSSDILNDMLSGAVDYAMMEPVFATAQHKQGKLRVLGLSSAGRLQSAPDFPTMAEQGITGIKMELWWAAFVPADTPKPISEQLANWFNQVTASEEASKFLNGFSSDPFIATPEEAQAKLQQEDRNWTEYIKIAKIEPQG